MCGQSGFLVNVDILVPNQTRYLSLIGNICEQLAKQLDAFTGDRDVLAYHLNLAVTEAMANAIQYSSPGDAKNTVRVCIRIEDENLYVQVYDHGQGFDLNAVGTPDFTQLNERGRGLFFIRSVMDSVEYHKTECGNVLEMRKKLA
jgi:serine/threonine-protein kinase RsbW